MKTKKTLVAILAVVILLSSCYKNIYEVDNVSGVTAEGELLLPVACTSFTMMEMMQRFEIDSLITFSEDGNMSYGFLYEHQGAVKGSELLRFKDWEYEAHFTFENPYPNGLPEPIDTTLTISQDVVFEAEHIHVMSALLKSGYFEFDMSSNISNLGQMVVTSSDIKDAQGHDFRFVYQPQTGQTGFDLAGLYYQTDEPNKLTLNYEFHAVVHQLSTPEMEFDVHILASDIALQEMHGYVDDYNSRNRIDTIFNLFPDNLSGSLEIIGARLRVSERNTFCLDAQLVVDTAMVLGEGITPYPIFESMPVVVDLPSQNTFNEVYSCLMSGQLNAVGSRALASSLFTVKAEGMSELVTMVDTSNIDVRVNVDIPFAFSIDDVRYCDTIEMKLSEIDMPDMIERLTIELTFNSTLPLNLGGYFYMYDSENNRITDTLLIDSQMIEASFDGKPTTTTLCIDVTEDRIENVMNSDSIIMMFLVDTDARDVVINAKQKLDVFAKAKVKYNGVVEF